MLSLHTTSFDGTCTMSYDEEFNHTAYVWLTSAQPSVCDVAYIEGPMLQARAPGTFTPRIEMGVAKGYFASSMHGLDLAMIDQQADVELY